MRTVTLPVGSISFPSADKTNPVSYTHLALEKLQLNDAALTFEAETSAALGFGFRCGFLGLLHMEIIEERIEREFNLDIITTAPSVEYKIEKTDGAVVMIDNPSHYPAPDEISASSEPMVKASIISPSDYVGGIMELCQERRGVFIDMKYICLLYTSRCV